MNPDQCFRCGEQLEHFPCENQPGRCHLWCINCWAWSDPEDEPKESAL